MRHKLVMDAIVCMFVSVCECMCVCGVCLCLCECMCACVCFYVWCVVCVRVWLHISARERNMQMK